MPKKGKKGVDQRVKGNVKTANSGRMAELLGGDAGAGFIGFDVPHGVGGEFQVVMKQLGKRDATTKLKALQEFSSLCETEPQEAVAAVLNLWTLMYNKLSMDNDNRVREASHRALNSCVQKVKNALRPHLKSIIGCWVSGMCDPHGSSASAAQNAFAAAFSLAKQRDVFMFGFKTILTYAEEMILKQTAETYSDPRVVPSDERVQRYERAVIMTIYGLSLTLQQLPSEYLIQSKATWEPLLSEKRLWKLGKHQNPFIRTASFSLVVTVCTQISEFVQSRGKQFCTLILGSLGESEPVVIGPLWEAALIVVTQIKSWSEHVNIQKALLPGLWSMLAAGGYGSAKVTYPCLLPLLSKLVEQVFTADVNFAKSFMERLNNGLQADRVRSSRLQCEVVMQTYTECYLYLLLHVCPEESEKTAFHQDLIRMIDKFYEKLSSLPQLYSRYRVVGVTFGIILLIKTPAVDLIEFSICEGSSVQCEVVQSATVKLVENLLHAQMKNTWMEPLMTNLQSEITNKLTHLLQSDPESKASISRIGDLLRCYTTCHTVPERKKVAFAVEESGNVYQQADDILGREEVKPSTTEFIRPTTCALCIKCISEVCGSKSVKHSELLVTLLKLYGDKELVRSLYTSLDSYHTPVVKQPSGDKLLILCATLLKSLDLKGLRGSSDNARKFTENVMECLVLLLYCGLVEKESIAMFFSELAKQHPVVLPLILLKLNETGQKEGIQSVLSSCQETLLSLIDESADKAFLWKFLELLLTKDTHFFGLELGSDVFKRVCHLLDNTFRQSMDTLSTSSAKKLLQIISQVHSSIVQDYEEYEITKLLTSLLHWCLHCMDTPGDYNCLLPEVFGCYSHLLSTLPELELYLQSVPSLITEQQEEEEAPGLLRYLQSALVIFMLHSKCMILSDLFWIIYHPMVTAASCMEEMHLPLAGLESFCQGSLLYSPFIEDLSQENVAPGISQSLQLALFPAVALCDPNLLRGISFQSSEAQKSEWNLDSILSTTGWDVGVAFLAEEKDLQKALGKNWMLLVISFALALTSLQECHLKTLSPVESQVVSILHSALARCLDVGVQQMEWLKTLLSGLVDRGSMEGPLWNLVLHQLFSSLENVLGSDRHQALQELISLLLKEPEGGMMQTALSGLSSSSLYCEQILEMARKRENDVCLMVACMYLLPDNDELLSIGARGLSDIASKHASSEISLFESLDEGSQDPFSFSVLELVKKLVVEQRVPEDSWDFVLCTLVTLTQLFTDEGNLPSVNQTVLYCHAMGLCHTVAGFLSSPFAQTQHSTEWLEFFQPALQEALLPHFLTGTDLDTIDGNSALVYQRLHMSRAVGCLVTTPQSASLERLLQTVLSPFYPHQVVAFLLAKRVLQAVQIVLTEDQAIDLKKTPISLSSLQGMLSKALDQVDLDLVFLEDSHTNTQVQRCHNTTAYVFIWLLVIEAMSHCDPETRGAMVEWLKELSLFDHLLHGLFKFLNESSNAGKIKELKVSLNPNLEQLACVAYSAVARQLPSMLRQWYLSVDKQTTTMVNKFTVKNVSPGLQRAELQAFNKSNTAIGNMEVRAYAGASEVAVVYKVDEFSIELFVCLPDNYPLQPPTIREGKRARVDASQWRKWLLQLNVFVANQNGSLLDGLMLWKSNLDKHFAGVEDCMICFSVIHGSNYSLPKMLCRTCKKKFHSACLYKWFHTSTKSTCPLCRNIF